MSDSVFDDPSIAFVVIVNHEVQYSLWPEPLSVPSGWYKVQGPMSRRRCTDWLVEYWTDLRPRSLLQDEKGEL